MTLVPIKPSPFNAESAVSQLAHDITPAAEFYVRSNFPLPTLDRPTFRLTVDGNVQRRLDLSLDDLAALGSHSLVTTMECAGNNRTSLAPLPSGEPWQSGAVSTGRWSGVALKSVLEIAGIRAGTVEVLGEGADRGKPKDGPSDIPFARSLPLAKALHPDSMLAWELNGEALPAHHGAPLRLVVPGWYGMAGVKWLIRISALTEPFAGYYQANRYIYDYGDGHAPTPVTAMLVKSTIVAPRNGDEIPVGPTLVRGRAWSGAGEIVKVEVAVEGGESWNEARLGPLGAPYSWRSWELEWPAADPGRHALRSRATDSVGNVQPPIGRWNKYGYAANGVQVVVVNTR